MHDPLAATTVERQNLEFPNYFEIPVNNSEKRWPFPYKQPFAFSSGVPKKSAGKKLRRCAGWNFCQLAFFVVVVVVVAADDRDHHRRCRKITRRIPILSFRVADSLFAQAGASWEPPY